MGARNYLWRFIFSLLLCTKTGTTEGRNVTTATAQIHISGSVSTEPHRTTGPATHNSSTIVAEPNATTARSLLDTSFLSPSTMRMVGGEGGTETESTRPNGEGTSQGTSSRSDVVSSATSTTGPGTTATSTGSGSGIASSLPLGSSSAVTSHSSSSPDGSTAATPGPQQSSTSSTTEEHLATTAHPSTTLVFSTLSSASGITSVQSAAVTAEHMTHSPTAPRTGASTAATSPASHTTKASLLSTPGGNTETSSAQHSSIALTQGQATVEAGTTPSSMKSPLPSTATASVGNSATTPPGEGESPTMTQGKETTTQLSAETAHSLPATSPVSPSTMRTEGGEGRTENTPTTPVWEGSSRGVSTGSAAMSIPSTGPDTTATSTDTGSGTTSSLPLGSSSAVTSHSSSSSPVGSTGVTPSLQQNSSSSTTEEHLATTSHPPTAPVSSPLSSTAGVTGDAVTAEVVTHSPAPSTPSTNPVASASSPSPASDTTEANLSSTPGGSTETSAAQHSSTTLPQGQATVETGTTPSSMGSPLPSTATASIGNSATTPPGEGESPTMTQGSGTTNNPSAETSHSLPDTSLATPSMSTLKMSTSVNPSVTGTCLPVSVEIQNVTGEEIQLSWTGGSTGSLYNISLMDGKQEIDKTTTKETKAVFKHLLPAHVYTISVGVSSCAQNNRTSVTVRTDPVSCFSQTVFCLPANTGCSDLKDIVCSDNQAFACSVLLKNQAFDNTLYNSDSEEYKAMAERIKTDVVREMRLELKDERFDITVLGFRPGSVIADFISLLPKEEPVDVNVIQAHLSKVLKRKFGDETQLTVQSLSVESPTDNISGWRVAVIVLGVLLGVALVLILLAILFYIYMRKRWGKYLVEPRDSWEILSKSTYKMHHVSFANLDKAEN